MTSSHVRSKELVLGGRSQPRTQQEAANQKVMGVFGDSLAATGRAAKASEKYDGRGYWNTNTLTNAAAFGSGTWVNLVMVDSTNNNSAGGTLTSDSQGQLSWTFSGDRPGPFTDVSKGGMFYLQSGSFANAGILVSVRGDTAVMPNATSAVVCTGVPTIADYNLISYVPWLAGAFGDTFKDYRTFAISSATSSDILKLMPKVLKENPLEVAVLMVGVNDLPDTVGKAQKLANNTIAMIDLCRAVVPKTYVQEVAPNPSATTTIQRFTALAMEIVARYVKTLMNVRFVSSYDLLMDPTVNTLTGRTGVYFTDNLHFYPYGAWVHARRLVSMIQADYPIDPRYYNPANTWDATLGIGSWNANPTLRGVGGTVIAAVGITGTAPDSYTLNRAGSTQTCQTTFETAGDAGASFWAMDVAGATAGDYHELSISYALPAGLNVGDYFMVSAEVCFFGMTAPGLNICQAYMLTNGNIQSAYLFQTGRDISTFTTELPILRLSTEPQKLLSGVTTITQRIRVGARTGGGQGKIGFRNWRITKVANHVYP